MKRTIIASLTALLFIAAQGAAHAQRGWSNPYPQYSQSPPGGGYLADGNTVGVADELRRCAWNLMI
jgi:hypothetical protein